MKYFLIRTAIPAMLLLAVSLNGKSQYLSRSLSSGHETNMELTNGSVRYMAMFGAGDDNSGLIEGLNRYGNLTIDPSGKSKNAKFPEEEIVVYILDGTGIFDCYGDKMPVTENDFIYIPAGTKFGFSNPRERKLSLLIMGFKIIPGDTIQPSARMMTASAEEVPFQILGSHGPTTQFQLLMGTTKSTRDRMATACRVNSLFVMDFAANGTNIPHRHDDEEEIYFILRGTGEIVAGETPEAKEFRHPSQKGDAWFFSPKTLIGFYSGNKEGEEHARILAVRFRYPK
jgi:mannose-6-phosphate isomerase-like protein (cupin superfamily)